MTALDAKLQSLVLRAEILKMELAYAHQHYGSSTRRLLADQLRGLAAEMAALSTAPLTADHVPKHSNRIESTP